MLFAQYDNATIWLIAGQFLVYGRTADPYITDSEGHAREVAGSC